MIAKQEMRAIEILKPGDASVLKPTLLPVPKPARYQILIQVAYAGVNRPDVFQRVGLYAPPSDASPLLGLEASGTVVSVGAGVTRWQVGDVVTALLLGGGYAEYALAHQDQALPLPKGMSLLEAACLPETCFTVWSNIVMRGGLGAKERFLVHGGSSGIGTMAIQIAKNLGAQVYATAGSEYKVKRCQELGAVRAFNYKTEEWDRLLKAEGGVDLILDMVGGGYIPRNLRCLADGGRLAQIAFLQGAKVELNLAQLVMRRLTITGSALRPQSISAKAEIACAVETNVWPMINAGRLFPVVNSVFPLHHAARAHRVMESSSHVGKIVLDVLGT